MNTSDAEPDAFMRTLMGGSGASTSLCRSAGNLVIRKRACGAVADKLREQVAWLRDHQNDLPLTPVLADVEDGDHFEYYMPVDPAATGFHQFIDGSPIPASLGILRDILETLDAFHNRFDRGRASDQQIDRYLAEKVVFNVRAILSDARARFRSGDYLFEGERFRLCEWEPFQHLDWLRDQIRMRGTSVIHGDLTIENIIVDPLSASGWYIIDPNPENIFNSPLIDWAKISQSLRLGYEDLNRSGHLGVAENGLSIWPKRSFAYGEMYRFSQAMLSRSLGPEASREVAFHEIVNYLRLLRSKMRHEPSKVPLFFVCASLLIRDYAGGPAAEDARLGIAGAA